MRRKTDRSRKAVATAEAAVLLPVVLMIAFGAIEFSNALYLRQSLTLGAYEAAMILAEPQSDLDTAEDVCDEILEARNVSEFTMTVTPDPSTDIDPGDHITVTVNSPASNFSMGPAFFMHDKTIFASVTVVRTP